jgi:hypothetical protein
VPTERSTRVAYNISTKPFQSVQSRSNISNSGIPCNRGLFIIGALAHGLCRQWLGHRRRRKRGPVLLSDGVAEATDPDGQLFGFERVHALIGAAGSASDVATTAQKFGQEDDISVISVTRVAARAPAFV